MRYVAFDLEITKEIPEGADWRTLAPLGISCAATIDEKGDLRLWHGPVIEGSMYNPQMWVCDIANLIDYLRRCQSGGCDIVTWNGLGFDFPVLYEELRNSRAYQYYCKQLALSHVDVAFAMLCDKGYMVGLDAAARGMGIQGKTEGMHGDMAPKMWAESREAQDKVLEYVAQDVRVTANLYLNLQAEGMLRWTSLAGRPNVWRFGVGGIPNVLGALGRPLPDTSWMSSPRPREEFYGWTGFQVSPSES